MAMSDPKTVEALREALEDEYKARATYRTRLSRFSAPSGPL